MIISRTPFRVSFFGGGTDYPAWFKEHGGAVLSTAIDRYCYITARHLPQFFDHTNRIVWSKIELVDEFSEIQHPAVRAVLSEMEFAPGLEIHHHGDLPSRSGLGTSSSFVVGLLHALNALRGQHVTNEFLAKKAIHIEQEVLQETVGAQDQVAAAYGGLNKLEFLPNGTFRVAPILLQESRLKALEDRMMLFFTGVSRFASGVAAEKVANFASQKTGLHRMREMVDEGVNILLEGELRDFGRLMDEGWQIKRGLGKKVAPSFVLDIYDRAKKAGADGGKVLGAGGGGFMLFMVEPENRQAVLDALSELLVVPIKVDWQGSQIVYYGDEPYSQTAMAGKSFVRYGNGEGDE